MRKIDNHCHIFGCGLSGMLTALALADAGINTSIIERKSLKELQDSGDPRTTALNGSSVKFMKSIGVWDELLQFTQPIKDIYVCQNMSDNVLHLKAGGGASVNRGGRGGTAQSAPTKQEDKYDSIGHMISNIDFRKTLLKLVQANDNIILITESSYENIESSSRLVKFDLVSSNGRNSIESDLVIAADGKFSNARKEFFADKMARDYKQKAIIFNISHEAHHEGGAIEHFLPRGSFATLPLPGGHESGIVWVEEKDIADFYLTQNDDFIVNTISKFIGGSLGNISLSTKMHSFPLEAYFTDKYYDGRLVLVADSAHCMHPLAGQGLNMGIKDVESLTSLMTDYHHTGLEYDESMLRKYAKTRALDNIAMVRITDTINRVFTSKIGPLNKITELGLSIIDNMPFIKDSIMSYGMGRTRAS